MVEQIVTLAHGSGRELSILINEVIMPVLDPTRTDALEDAAALGALSGDWAFTTDSFVVHPLSFKGGDIGKLAACGTINDLAMMGARPLFMAVSLIIEEGLRLADLRTYLASLYAVCAHEGVKIACGDTKVVERGKGDGLYITTSGVGRLHHTKSLSVSRACESDVVIVSGPIARHGIAIMTSRNALTFASSVVSDCASLCRPALSLVESDASLRLMRDATRGGCAAILNEIAEASGVTIVVDEESVPIDPDVKAACGYFGIDPLEVANEGTFVAIVAQEGAEDALRCLRGFESTQSAQIVGTVRRRESSAVLLRTSIGALRPVDVPAGRILPRIC